MRQPLVAPESRGGRALDLRGRGVATFAFQGCRVYFWVCMCALRLPSSARVRQPFLPRFHPQPGALLDHWGGGSQTHPTVG